MGLRAKIAAVELAGDEVRLAVITAGGRRPRVLEMHACRAIYDTEDTRREALVRAVQTVADAVQSTPSAYVLCVSSANTVVRTLTIPFRGRRRVAAAVQFELEPYLAFPIEELVIDHTVVREGAGQTDVLVVGIRHAVLEDQLAILSAAGIDPEGIGVDAIGLTGLWRTFRGHLKGLHAVLHVRDDASLLAVVSGKTLAYFRYLPVSAGQIIERPAAAIREVQNSIRAFHAGWRGEGRVSALAVTGARALESQREAFEQELDMPVTFDSMMPNLKIAKTSSPAPVAPAAQPAQNVEEAMSPGNGGPAAMDSPAPLEFQRDTIEQEIDPLFTLDSVMQDLSIARPPSRDPAASVPGPALDFAETAEPALPPEPSNKWEAAIGVASGASSGGGYAMNFRKGPLAFKNALENIVPHIMVAACLALMLLVGVAWYYRDAWARNQTASQETRDQIDALKIETEGLRAKGVNVTAETFSDPTLLDILAEIAAKMPDEKVAVQEVRVERAAATAPWITIQGEVRDDSVFGAVYADLKKSVKFKVDDEPELKLVEGKSTFKISIRRPEGADSTS